MPFLRYKRLSGVVISPKRLLPQWRLKKMIFRKMVKESEICTKLSPIYLLKNYSIHFNTIFLFFILFTISIALLRFSKGVYPPFSSTTTIRFHFMLRWSEVIVLFSLHILHPEYCTVLCKFIQHLKFYDMIFQGPNLIFSSFCDQLLSW